MIECSAAVIGGFVDPMELPDGSGVMIASFPLPKDHWLYQGLEQPEPMFETAPGIGEDLKNGIRQAAKWAVCGATMNGAVTDFDPDALVQNLIFALFGPSDAVLALTANDSDPVDGPNPDA